MIGAKIIKPLTHPSIIPSGIRSFALARPIYPSKPGRYPQEWSAFDIRWNQATPTEQAKIRAELDELQKQDWRTLSKEQIAAIYTSCYGEPESPSEAKKESIKVWLGTIVFTGLGVAMYYGAKMFAQPDAPEDRDPERLAAQQAYKDRYNFDNPFDLKASNANKSN